MARGHWVIRRPMNTPYRKLPDFKFGLGGARGAQECGLVLRLERQLTLSVVVVRWSGGRSAWEQTFFFGPRGCRGDVSASDRW